VKHGTGDKLEELILILIIYNFNSQTGLFFLNRFIIISVSQSDENVVIMVEFKELSTRQPLITMFVLTVIKLLHIQNITLEFQ